MTKIPKPSDVNNHHLAATWDGWNRLVKLQTDAQTPATVAEYQYDGLQHRIVKLLPSGNNWARTDFYYNDGWQVLTETAGTFANKTTVATAAKVEWLWDIRYVDAPVCRWRDADNDTNHTLEESWITAFSALDAS